MSTDAWAPQREAVKRALRDTGLSQAQLARDLGMSAKHLSQMLTGAVDGRVELWARIATRLGMTWKLSQLDPHEQVIRWAETHLGVTLEAWQAARLREFMDGL